MFNEDFTNINKKESFEMYDIEREEIEKFMREMPLAILGVKQPRKEQAEG